MQSEFNEELDDYEASYSVFLLPDSVGEAVQEGNWGGLYKAPLAEIGKIPVSSVVFDDRKRKELDASCLDALIDSHELQANG